MALEMRRRPGTTPSLRERLKDRSYMLQFGMRWSARWLMAQGAFGLLFSVLFVNVEHVRDHPLALIPQANLGAALLALGFFISRGIQDPAKQHLAVDALILYYIMAVIGLMSNVARVPEVLALEWLSALINLAFLFILGVTRTRADELKGQAGAPKDARDAAKDLIRSLRGIIEGSKRRPSSPAPSEEAPKQD
jgi:hypothetical protein